MNGAFAGQLNGTNMTLQNCYALVDPTSDGTYTELCADPGVIVNATNSAVVAAENARIFLSTGSIKFDEMYQRISQAIADLVAVEMPVGGFSDGLERDYSWYYADGAVIEDAGTKTNPYVIDTKEKFAALSSLSNGFHDPAAIGGSDERVNFNGKYFKLGADIDMTGYMADPLNMEGATIEFDGNNKTISNWKIENTKYGGVFSAVGRNSVVKDLTLDNVDVVAKDNSAVLISSAKSGLTVYNVYVKSTCSVEATEGKVGAGIVATIIDDVAGESDDVPPAEETLVKISFCINEASVKAKNTIGGIVGMTNGKFGYTYSYCANTGALEITSTKNQKFIVGGILGVAEKGEGNSAAWDGDTYIKDCYNKGSIKTPTTKSDCVVGGIAAAIYSATGYIDITRCYDLSSRDLSTNKTSLKNGGISAVSEGAVLKYMDISYAANAVGSKSAFVSATLWDDEGDLTDIFSMALLELDEAILDGNGVESTIEEEIARLHTAITTLTEAEWDFVDPTPVPGGNQENNQQNNQQNAPAETTAAVEEEKTGCGSALNSTYAVLALVAVLGFAFVAKKKEEN